jgi:cytochrome c553
LAGLHAAYLAHQLQSIQAGQRINPIMQPIAGAMNEQEIENVSAYYAALQPPTTAAVTDVDQDLLQEGKRLAEIGNWNKEIPACVSCHGPNGRGAGPVFPALAGQPAAYLATQIKDWKKGQRKNDPNQLMQVVAERMSEREIQAVTAYFASLSAAAE